MRVYFAASTSGIPKFEKNYRAIIDMLTSLKLKVAESWVVDKLNGKERNITPEESVKKDIKQLSLSDFFIAEVAVPSFGVSIAISQALNQKKSVLCLYPKGVDQSQLSDIFLGYYNNSLRLDFYDETNLKQIIKSSLEDLSERTNLSKFNFLISPDIDEYLEWATKNKNRSKSEILREEIIRKIIHQDEEFLSSKQKHRR